ncbi:hypothetical protein JM84_1412 [Dokdonia sp. Hel_I_63]|uniref:hypothetical protein n=1 Tax=Dokdonia sp. Hel_I_63 TaxID=1249996 RepID=UPI00119C8EFA|nr:hypothetical protein [Dokdonia sp. Hel_I_63]TVZ22510.1 hypothetical protein JM84_1412 [Dokdonia sp. Hel_I_63]
MKKEPIDQVFKRLEGRLDTAAPSADHKANFLAKLQAQTTEDIPAKETKAIQWMRPLFIAASVILIAGLMLTQFNNTPQAKELADVSPEMENTQDFFTKTIERELFDIKENMNPENQAMVMDAIKQLEILEKNYDNLKKDLSESGEDKRVIYAMIDNFQNRIDLLQQVVEQMDAIKELNTIEKAVTL